MEIVIEPASALIVGMGLILSLAISFQRSLAQVSERMDESWLILLKENVISVPVYEQLMNDKLREPMKLLLERIKEND